jgi:hypothetical protein
MMRTNGEVVLQSEEEEEQTVAVAGVLWWRLLLMRAAFLIKKLVWICCDAAEREARRGLGAGESRNCLLLNVSSRSPHHPGYYQTCPCP